MKNPLHEQGGLPPFKQINASHVFPAIEELLEQNRNQIKSLLESTSDYTWDNFISFTDDMDDKLGRAWSPASHLHSVADNDELREAYNKCLPLLSDYATEMGQNPDLYQAYKHIAESKNFADLQEAQQKIINNALRDFRLSGIELDASKQKRFKEIAKELSELTTKFEENLLDATHDWNKHITDEKQLSGLPESAIALAKQTAEREKLEGWLFNLEFPSYLPVMQYADDPALREEMYVAYNTRASDQGPNAGKFDNSDLMLSILALRKEKAELLGYESYAHYSLATKMAETPEEVLEFLTDLAHKSKVVAQQELDDLKKFAQEKDDVTELHVWDIPYYSEKLRQHKFDISQEALRPYFSVPVVLEGLFSVLNSLYGFTVKQRNDVETWHDDVQFFDIYDGNKLRGSFYLDLFARQKKRGGAWMDECIVRRQTTNGLQSPVAYLTCNFTPPIGDKPSLITHDEVITLFHEFGHGLHHMLTQIDYAGVSGINGVAWDAVELPSQFMENWCWEREALDMFAKHIDTNETISDELYQRMQAAKTFQSGMQMLRQLEFALFDFRLHLEFDPDGSKSIQELLDQVRNEIAVVIPPSFNRFQHSFSHIFAGGYAAGYYSYKWAEVLSADAFAKFEETGIFNQETGKSFLQNILEKGGSKEPMELFVAFRGRKPSIDALLRHSGIKV